METKVRYSCFECGKPLTISFRRIDNENQLEAVVFKPCKSCLRKEFNYGKKLGFDAGYTCAESALINESNLEEFHNVVTKS